MTNILKGKPVVDGLKSYIKSEILELKSKDITPTMGIIRVGNRADDIAYEKSIIKNCKSVGMNVQVFEADKDITMEEFEKLVKKVNVDNNIHGILMFRPLPSQLNIEVIKHLIDPKKDIDCINPINLEKVFEGEMDGFCPCTPQAVMEILKYYEVPLQGANAVVINRSMVLGKPLAMMLLKENATVTICHSKTKNITKVASAADIVVTGVGKAKLIGEEYFNENTVVIDVGINISEEGKLCGDVDYEKVCNNVGAITPVPGGVGTVTTAILLRHVLDACIGKQL